MPYERELLVDLVCGTARSTLHSRTIDSFGITSGNESVIERRKLDGSSQDTLSLAISALTPRAWRIKHTFKSKRFMALAKFMLSHMKTNLALGCSFRIVFNES